MLHLKIGTDTIALFRLMRIQASHFYFVCVIFIFASFCMQRRWKKRAHRTKRLKEHSTRSNKPLETVLHLNDIFSHYDGARALIENGRYLFALLSFCSFHLTDLVSVSHFGMAAVSRERTDARMRMCLTNVFFPICFLSAENGFLWALIRFAWNFRWVKMPTIFTV